MKTIEEYIARGHDLQTIIRQNQLLRAANRKIITISKHLISTSINYLAEIFPHMPSYQSFPDHYQEVVEQFLAHLEGLVKVQVNQRTNQQHANLSSERQQILNLQERIQQYQCTVNEVSLIAQRLEHQLGNSKIVIDQLKIDLTKQKLNSEKMEQGELKWRSRFQVLRKELSEVRQEERIIWEESKQENRKKEYS